MPPRRSPTRSPAILSLAAVLALAHAALSAVTLDIRDATGDGHKDILVNNGFFSATFEPARGGSVTSFVFQGQEYALRENNRADGLFKALVRPWDWRSDFFTSPAVYRFIAQTPDEVVIEFKSTGSTGDQQFLDLTKTFTIRAGECALRAAFELHNQERSQTELTAGFWIHHHIIAPGAPLRYFLPTQQGTLSVAAESRNDADAGVWNKAPSRGWSGCVNVAKSCGLAFVCDEVYLERGLCWFTGQKDRGSVEHHLYPVPIPFGRSWKTGVCLIPFTGMDRLDGAGASAAGELLPSAGAARVEVRLVPAASGALDLRAAVVDPSDAAKVLATLGAQRVETQAGQPVSASFDVPPAARDGVLICDVTAPGQPSFRLERRLGANAEEPYAMARLLKPYAPPKTEVYTPAARRNLTTSDRIWAKALPGGPLKASCILPTYNRRQMVELAQRFGFDYLEAPVSARSMFLHQHAYGVPVGQQAPGEARAVEMLAEHLKAPAPVLLIGSCYSRRYASRTPNYWTWSGLPKNIRQAILDKVKAGCGLVYVNPIGLDKEAEEALVGQPVSPEHEILNWAPPGFTAKPEQILVKEYGKGRVVALRYSAAGLLPFTECGFYPKPAHVADYWYALTSRAMLWAARRQPALQLGPVSRATSGFQAAAQGALANACVDYELRDAFGQRLAQGSVPAAPALTLPVVVPSANGDYYLHLFARAGGVTHDWRVFPITVKAPARIAEFTVETPPTAGKPARLRLRVEGAAAKLELLLRSTAGDLYKRLELLPPATTQSIPFTVPDLPGLTADIEARLLGSGGLLDRAFAKLPLPDNSRQRRNRYFALVWGADPGCTDYESSELAGRQLRRIGFSVTLSSFATYSQLGYQIAQMFLDAGLSPMMQGLCRPTLTNNQIAFRYQQTGDTKYLWRDPCYSSAEFRDMLTKRIEDMLAKTLPLGFLIYHWGDECSYTFEGGTTPLDICFHPDSLREFRVWLKTQYPSLDALNAEWLTDFKDWDAVTPLPFDKVKGRKSFAPWADHRLFSDYQYCVLTWKRFGDEIRKRDPGAIVGEGGITAHPLAYGGFNWPLKLSSYQHAIPYGYAEVVAQLARNYPGFRFSTRWTGYNSPLVNNHYSVWSGLLMGATNTSYWYAHHLIDPDMNISCRGEPMKALLAELNSGLADLLASGKRQLDPVAVLYSQPSVLAAYAWSGRGADTYTLYQVNLKAWIESFQDAGFQPALITEDHIRHTPARVLVLPMAMALSEQAAAAIRDFVHNGGVVIADLMPGVMSAHARPLDKPLLDDLFGVSRATPPALSRQAANLHLRLPELGIDNGLVSTTLVETGLRAQEAQARAAMSETPTRVGKLAFSRSGGAASGAAFLRQDGKGYALYLAALPSSLRDAATGRNILAPLLAKTGVDRGVDLKAADASPLQGVSVNRYKLGPVTLIGLNEPPENIPGARVTHMTLEDLRKHTRPVTLRTPQPCHFYDVRAHRLLGQGVQVVFNTTMGTGNLVAASPFPIGEVILDKPEQRARPGETVILSGRVPGAESLQSFARIQFDTGNPDRDTLLSSLVEITDGRFTHNVLTPLDAKTPWRITITEAITGHTAQSLLTFTEDRLP